MIIKNVRVDWLFVWERSKDDKYSVCVMVPKDHPDLPRIEKAIDAAIKQGIEKGKFNEAAVKSSTFKKCLRDGTAEFESEERPERYKDHMFFNASNAKQQPGVVGPDGQPLLTPDRLYSGCYCHVDIGFFAYNHPKGGKGIGAGFNNIMLVKEGDRLDGGKSAEEAFAGLAGDTLE